MTAAATFYALVTAAWTAAMICAARLAHREHRPTDTRHAIAAAALAWTWPATVLAGLTWYALNRKRIP